MLPVALSMASPCCCSLCFALFLQRVRAAIALAAVLVESDHTPNPLDMVDDVAQNTGLHPEAVGVLVASLAASLSE
jgi:hypothetical protein